MNDLKINKEGSKLNMKNCRFCYQLSHVKLEYKARENIVKESNEKRKNNTIGAKLNDNTKPN